MFEITFYFYKIHILCRLLQPFELNRLLFYNMRNGKKPTFGIDSVSRIVSKFIYKITNCKYKYDIL